MEKITLKAARVNKGLTRKEAAEKADITPESIGNYESGRRLPRIDVLIRLAKVYGIKLDQIKWDWD